MKGRSQSRLKSPCVARRIASIRCCSWRSRHTLTSIRTQLSRNSGIDALEAEIGGEKPVGEYGRDPQRDHAVRNIDENIDRGRGVAERFHKPSIFDKPSIHARVSPAGRFRRYIELRNLVGASPRRPAGIGRPRAQPLAPSSLWLNLPRGAMDDDEFGRFRRRRGFACRWSSSKSGASPPSRRDGGRPF